MKKRIVVIGGGPGGYVAAIRASQLGGEVHIIESNNLGGTCLNVGCIPTKALLHTAELFHTVKESAAIGLLADSVRVDWDILQKHKASVVNRLVRGVEGLLKANKVVIHKGVAKLSGSHTVQIEGGDSITSDIIILAPGSETVRLRFPGAELNGVIDSTAALSLPEIPPSIIIVGGGVIGVEFAALYRSLGAKVTVVEMLPQILPPVDGQIAAIIRKELSRQGVEFYTSARLTEVREIPDGLEARVVIDNEEKAFTAKNVLIAVGRKPRISNLGLEEAGIKIERGAVVVDDNFETNVPGIYAIGDCNARIMLAHAASAQGIAAVEHAAGHKNAYNGKVIPYCIYTSPEAAGVGLTEEQARSRGVNYKVGVFPLSANGKSMVEGCQNGLVKIITEDRLGEIIGAHIVGPRATDLIGEIAMAMNLEATAEELISTIHPHPTVSESLAEAALNVNGKAIHWPPVSTI